MSLPQQAPGKVKTYKSGGAGNKYLAHPIFLSRLRGQQADAPI
jgi:hypothetical protein